MMKKKKILLWYDVEDYVTEEAENALLKLLELMHEYGVRATLKLCTKKYEQLIHNGRTDILELLADHELAFHMTNHSVHPIPSEYLDRMGFAQGALEFERREGQGFARLKSLTGQNLTSYGHPGVRFSRLFANGGFLHILISMISYVFMDSHSGLAVYCAIQN